MRDAVSGASTAFTAAGLDSPRLDAELLVAGALGIDRAALYADPQRAVEGDAVRAVQAAVRRRAVDREPVAYILGRRAFRGLELEVDPRVLIPRPETELLVEVALELPQGARVIDVGTGSGAVALALKDERPDLDVTASDVSGEALEVARANGTRLGLEVRWLRSDLLADADGPYDAVLANLPYVEEGARLAPEIARHEPARALFAGPDGLDVIRRLVCEVTAPVLALEIGAGQAAAVSALLAGAGFGDVRARADLAGVTRVLIARRRSEAGT